MGDLNILNKAVLPTGDSGALASLVCPSANLCQMTAEKIFSRRPDTPGQGDLLFANQLLELLSKFQKANGLPDRSLEFNLFSREGQRAVVTALQEPHPMKWLGKKVTSLKEHFAGLIHEGRITMWRGLTVDLGFRPNDLLEPIGACWTFERTKAISYDGNYNRIGKSSIKVVLQATLDESQIDWPETFRENISFADQVVPEWSEQEIRPLGPFITLDSVCIDGKKAMMKELKNRRFRVY